MGQTLTTTLQAEIGEKKDSVTPMSGFMRMGEIATPKTRSGGVTTWTNKLVGTKPFVFPSYICLDSNSYRVFSKNNNNDK